MKTVARAVVVGEENDDADYEAQPLANASLYSQPFTLPLLTYDLHKGSYRIPAYAGGRTARGGWFVEGQRGNTATWHGPPSIFLTHAIHSTLHRSQAFTHTHTIAPSWQDGRKYKQYKLRARQRLKSPLPPLAMQPSTSSPSASAPSKGPWRGLSPWQTRPRAFARLRQS